MDTLKLSNGPKVGCKVQKAGACDGKNCPGTGRCKDYRSKKYNLNKEHEKQNVYKWRKENKEKLRELNRKWIKDNPQKRKDHDARYYLANRDKKIAISRLNYKLNYKPVGDQVYAYINEEFVKVDSLPEAYLMVELYQLGIEFIAHPLPSMKTVFGKYYPDIYIPAWNMYIEVKGYILMGRNNLKQYHKINYLRASGHDIVYMSAQDIVAELYA
jgi:hypothetical protein